EEISGEISEEISEEIDKETKGLNHKNPKPMNFPSPGPIEQVERWGEGKIHRSWVVSRRFSSSFPPHNNPNPDEQVMLPVIQKRRAEARSSRHKVPTSPRTESGPSTFKSTPPP